MLLSKGWDRESNGEQEFLSAEKVPVWGSLQVAEATDRVTLSSTLIWMGSAVKVIWSLVHGRILCSWQCSSLLIASHIPPPFLLYGEEGLWLWCVSTFGKLWVFLIFLAKRALQQVKDACRKWHSAVLYVMRWSNPFMPIWQLTSLGGLSIKLQNLIKSDKQISCISRGRIVINQARALQLAARPHVLTHWESDFKDGLKWQNRWVGNLSPRSFWHAPSSNTARHPVCCFARVHVFAEWVWFLGIGH